MRSAIVSGTSGGSLLATEPAVEPPREARADLPLLVDPLDVLPAGVPDEPHDDQRDDLHDPPIRYYRIQSMHPGLPVPHPRVDLERRPEPEQRTADPVAPRHAACLSFISLYESHRSFVIGKHTAAMCAASSSPSSLARAGSLASERRRFTPSFVP